MKVHDRPFAGLNARARWPTTGPVSVEAVVARISMIQQGLQPPASPAGASAAPVSPAWSPDGAAPVPSAFASMLSSAAPGAAAVSPPAGSSVGGVTPLGGDAGSRMIGLAQQELARGVAEQPPGSNDGPRIAEYRTATAGSGVGPWCAYFVSWLARQAGTPVGEAGQGFGSVDALHAWAQRTGRTTDTPAPGELVVWDEHVGLVTGVDPDGTIHTIEGNSSDRVSARTYGPDGGGAQTYVKLG